MVGQYSCHDVILLISSSAGAWSTWETALSKLVVDPAYIAKANNPKW